MAIIEADDIAGVYVDGHQQLLCRECFNGNLRGISLDDILTQGTVDNTDDIYFCDECKEAI